MLLRLSLPAHYLTPILLLNFARKFSIIAIINATIISRKMATARHASLKKAPFTDPVPPPSIAVLRFAGFHSSSIHFVDPTQEHIPKFLFRTHQAHTYRDYGTCYLISCTTKRDARISQTRFGLNDFFPPTDTIGPKQGHHAN